MKLKNTILFFIMLSSFVYSAAEGIYEAEDAILSGAVIRSNHSGYSGTGFVDYQRPTGDYIEWTVNTDNAGQYFLHFRYALGNADRPLEISVNGQVVVGSQSFPSTGGWTNWDITEDIMVNLVEGNNIIRAEAIGSSGANVDYLEVKSIKPVLDYRMDECFWLGSGYDDVRTNTANTLDQLDGSAFNGTQPDLLESRINHAATFDGTDDHIVIDSDLLNFSDEMSISFWVYSTLGTDTEVYISKYDFTDGWVIWSDDTTVNFRLNAGNSNEVQVSVAKPGGWADNWHFITAIYDGNEIKLYVDSNSNTESQSGTINNITGLMTIGELDNGAGDHYYYQGNIDEIKLFDIALTDTQRTTLYNNELAGKNYDGTIREPIVCSASTGEKDWQLIGIPAEARAAYETITFDDVFSSVGTAGVDYFAYRPVYEPLENTTTYAAVTGTENIEFGTAYWLTTAVATTWDVEGLVNVDYDISKDDVDACTDNRCVEIDIVPAVSDGDDSSGPNNYTMFGFVGKSPVDWADCRIVIDGTDIYTPEEADSLGYISREIWSWPSGLGTGSDGNVRGSDYHSCTDVSVAGCQLIPFQGYWIQTKPDSIGHTVQILLPKGDDQ